MHAVVGDIHGCYFTLRALYQKVRQNYPDIDFYSVGDLVDRGNYSAEVIEFIIDNRIKPVLGNHDVMFIKGIKQPWDKYARLWEYNGKTKTLRSYQRMPHRLNDHVSFLESQPYYYNLEDSFISHAGISSVFRRDLIIDGEVRFDLFEHFVQQHIYNDEGIIWCRSRLLPLGKLQIVGHCRKLSVLHQRENNAIYIDTSVYTGNKLTAVIIDNGEIIDTITISTKEKDLFF